MNTNFEKDIKACTDSILNRCILFACSCITREHIPDESIKTASTDGKSIKYNPEYFYSLGFDQRKTLICHELLHILLGHHLRLRGKDSEKWNIACDYVINIILVEMGFKPIDMWYLDYKYKGMSAEDIYKTLENSSVSEQQKQKMRSCGEFEEPRNDNGETLSDSELEEEKIQQEKESRQAKSQLNRRLSGIEKSNTLKDNEKKNLINEISKGSTNLIERLDDYRHSRIDWRSVIHRFLLEETTEELNPESFDFYAMENQDFEIIQNERHSHSFGKIAFCMDVSDSLSFLSKDICQEAFHALEHTHKRELAAYWISDKIDHKKTVTDVSEISHVKGNGTDFRPFFNEECLTAEFHEKFDGIIFITDGFVMNMKTWIEPHCDVLWILTRANTQFENNVPFGEVIRMNT